MCKFPLKIYRRRDPVDTTPIVCDDGNPYYLVPCGRCVDCIRRKKNDWYVRAREEVNSGQYGQILWLSCTFRDERLPYTRSDISAKIRAFKDRLRKHLGYSPVHFFVSERGGKQQDGRIHLHGLLFLRYEVEYNFIRNLWEKFEGFIWIEPTKSLRGVTYMFKYMMKGLLQRYRNGDELMGYIWASLGFGNHLKPAQLLAWFRPSDPYAYEKTITYDSRFHYAIPRYLIGKVIKYNGAKKLMSLENLIKQTEEVYYVSHLLKPKAIEDGFYIPRPQLCTPYKHNSDFQVVQCTT